MIRRRPAQLLQGRARLRRDGEAAVRQGRGVADLGKALSQMNDQPADAAVPDQQVGAVADQRDGHVQLPGRLKRGADLFRPVRLAQKLGRAAQMQGGITAHGYVFHQLFFGKKGQQPFVQGLHGSRFHGASPFVPETRGRIPFLIVAQFRLDVKTKPKKVYAKTQTVMHSGEKQVPLSGLRMRLPSEKEHAILSGMRGSRRFRSSKAPHSGKKRIN